MVSELDIYRAANALIKQYGEAAPLEAAMRADKMLDIGDVAGKAIWLRILTAVETILRARPNTAEKVH